jgi:hypothetical protein
MVTQQNQKIKSKINNKPLMSLLTGKRKGENLNEKELGSIHDMGN